MLTAALALLACSTPSEPLPEGASVVTIAYAGRMEGEIEPCG